MSPPAQCPFCLRPFQTVTQLTNHLIFDHCEVATDRPTDPPTDGENGVETTSAPGEEIVPLS